MLTHVNFPPYFIHNLSESLANSSGSFLIKFCDLSISKCLITPDFLFLDDDGTSVMSFRIDTTIGVTATSKINLTDYNLTHIFS